MPAHSRRSLPTKQQMPKAAVVPMASPTARLRMSIEPSPSAFVATHGWMTSARALPTAMVMPTVEADRSRPSMKVDA